MDDNEYEATAAQYVKGKNIPSWHYNNVHLINLTTHIVECVVM